MYAKRRHAVQLVGLAIMLALPRFDAAAQVQCWAPRRNEDAAVDPAWAPMHHTMLAAEEIIRKNTAFLTAPEVVRMRTTVSVGPRALNGARLQVSAYPETSDVGSQVWTGTCEVIPQADIIDASVGQVDVFFNTDVRDAFFGAAGLKLTGHVAGYPEYNGWVVMTKDGRLPWIPLSLKDQLDAEGARREKILAEWKAEIARRSVPDDAKAQQAFERRLDLYRRYRASFSPSELEAPAVWNDPSGDGQRRLDARLKELAQLSAGEQKQVDDWGREARVLQTQAQVEAIKNKNQSEAVRLRAQVNDLANKVRAVRVAHQANASFDIEDARQEFKLVNIKPGDKEHAMGYKPDPTFPDYRDQNRIQVITVAFFAKANRHQVTPRGAWIQRTQDTFDFAALAAMLR
jgi:hypothetical protein